MATRHPDTDALIDGRRRIAPGRSHSLGPHPEEGRPRACVARDHHAGLFTPGVGAMPQTAPLWVETSEVPTFREIIRGLAPRGLHPRAAALHRGATLMAGGLGDSVLSHRTVYNDLV
jgi:hypothetical protein